MNQEHSIGDYEKALQKRTEAEDNLLMALREADRKAEKWDDWQRHVNSGAQAFGED